MKSFILLTMVLLLWSGSVMAQERGIGVTPARIEIGSNVEWPYTVPLLVTNFSSERELFEVTLKKDHDVAIGVDPGRFTLDAGKTTRILLTFENPGKELSGMIRIAATRTSAEGLATGTGIEIPFQIETGENTKFLASAAESAGRFSQIFGAFLILATLVVLWQLSNIVEPWIWHSTKR